MDKSSYELAQDFVFKWEGGYCDVAGDSGGATNMGISLRFLSGLPLKDGDIDGDGDIDKADIKHLTKEDALRLYKDFFWDNYDLDSFPFFASIVFYDTAINAGGGRASRILQQICNFYSGHTVAIDGKIGPKTIKAVKAICSNPEADRTFAIRFIEERRKFYNSIIANNPVLQKFKKGWFRRCADLEALIFAL